MFSRTHWLVLLAVIALFLNWLTDANTNIINVEAQYASLINVVSKLSGAFLLLIGVLIARKVMHPYIDMAVYAKKALSDPYGAGMVFVGMSLIMLAFTAIFIAAMVYG